MKGFLAFAVLASMAAATPVVLPTYNSTFEAHQAIEARQGAGGWGSNGAGGCSTSRVVCNSQADSSPGGGDPHQSYYHIQLSDPISCDDGDCSVGETETESTTIGFSIGTNSNFKPGDIAVWLQPSFSVTQSWTTGNSYTCNAKAGERVAIWQNVAHTAYSVANTPSGNCGYGDDAYKTYTNVYQAPNANNEGGGFYCVRDATPDDHNVRNKGDNYWQGGCAGGPQGYCGI